MDNLVYGKRITEEVYREGSVISGATTTEVSIKLDGLQQLWDNLIMQVGRLQTEDEIDFKLKCDKESRLPRLMIVSSKRVLK